MKDFSDFADEYRARFDDEGGTKDDLVIARVALDMLSQYHDWLVPQLHEVAELP